MTQSVHSHTRSDTLSSAGIHADPSLTGKMPENIVLMMSGVMLGLLLAALDGTIVSTVMPTIAGQLQGMEYYVWPFTVYMLTSTIAIIIFGKLSDLYGRKPVFISGILIFLLGSILCGIASSMVSLILFRGLQGLGGGILMTVSFIMVAEIFPIWQRGKYMGILASVFGIASIIGPVIGGFITEHIGWSWVFFINIPLGIISLGMIWRWFPSIAPVAVSGSIDRLGIVTFIMAMIPLFFGLSFLRSSTGGVSPVIIGMIIISLVIFGLFIKTQLNASDPILSLGLFRSKVYSISMIAAFLANALFLGPIIYLPLFVQNVLKMSATTAGMVITPMVVSMIIAAIITGQMISRTRRYKKLALAGFVIIAVSMVMLSVVQPDTPMEFLIIASILLGYGSGIMHPLFSVASQNAFTFKEIGVISSSLQFSRNMGATIVTPVLGVIMYAGMGSSGVPVSLATVSPEILSYAISLVFKSCLVLTVLAFVVTCLLEDVPIKPRTPHSS